MYNFYIFITINTILSVSLTYLKQNIKVRIILARGTTYINESHSGIIYL